MSFFIITLSVLVLAAISLFNQAKKTILIPKDVSFERLQNNYLNVYYLATFSDWLQGPYVYKLYSDYGYEEEEIAILYMAGFASSSLFGAIVGYLADKYGRKRLCISFGFFYSVCCLTKLSTDFNTLLFGRVLGGISTSILFSTFEAWYVNEHVNHLNLPPEWLNITFSKAGFYTGFLAILAGILSYICAEALDFGASSPFILAIPFLLTSSYLICKTWKEHTYPHSSAHQSFMAPLYLMFYKEPILLILGLVQSLFEAVLYTFIFSWTPIMSELQPPLGLVFACFMLALMVGSKIYSLLLSDRLPPQLILVLTSWLSFLCFGTVALVMSYILYMNEHGHLTLQIKIVLTQVCFLCFVLYEISVGVYSPAIGYLRGRVVPEEYRASIANWFRVPMNVFTCISLTINQGSKYDPDVLSVVGFKHFHVIYVLCSVFLLFTTLASLILKVKYNKRFSKEESFNESKDIVKDNDLVVKDKPVPS